MKAAPIILILTFFLFFYLNCANRSEKDSVDLPHESDTSTLPSKETPIAPITGIYWQLAALSGKPMAQLPAQNKEPYILFREDGIVEATGGCNGMSGQYEIMEGGKIKITRLVSTKMACPDMSVETSFSAALQSAAIYRSEGDTLTIGTEADPAMATFVVKAR